MKIGDRVRVAYSGECLFCETRDPGLTLEGAPGTIAHDMRARDRSPLPGGSLFNHIWEVRLDSGPLKGVHVPYFGLTLDLPEPNFAESELRLLEEQEACP